MKKATYKEVGGPKSLDPAVYSQPEEMAVEGQDSKER
jgi:hypothetical protein